VKDLYNEDYKELKKEILEHIRRWKDSLSSWIDMMNIIKSYIAKSDI
jgi:hypothetical protein